MKIGIFISSLVVIPPCFALDLASEPLQPLPVSKPIDAKKIELGRKLFFDKRLSKDGTISCASCHDLNKGGTDLEVVSSGIKNLKGAVNAPTVYNSQHNFVFFWDGRAATLEQQAEGPVVNPVEMGADWNEVVKSISADPEYIKLFSVAYGSAINKASITKAIADFERSLDTPSRFDDYLKGNDQAINAQEKLGYSKFKQFGCIACHNGANVGGAMYQKLGLVHDYFKDQNRPLNKADYGRFNVTGNEVDKYYFKVPSLRNVALTPPYFHDGSVKSLNEAVKKMGYYQLGQNISDEDAADIVAFLKSLTGKSLEKSAK